MKCGLVPYQVDSPTDDQRHEMLKYLLCTGSRPEDFNNIISLLSPPPDITTICPKGWGKNVRVAVIGAGEAGLAAAFELRKIGCDITIFEATQRIGGRIYTHYFGGNNQYPAELGAMRISPSHEATWHYINLFKLSTRPFATRNINGLFYLRGAWAVNDPEGLSVRENIYPRYNLPPSERAVPWTSLSGRLYDRYLISLPPEVRKQLIDIRPVYSPEIVEIDRMDFRSAYESVGLSQHAIAMIGYLSAFEQSFFKLSLTEILQEAYTADFSFTYRINDGMINLPLSFYRALMDEIPDVYGGTSKEELGKVTFKMGFPVDGIYYDPEGRGIVIQYRNECTYESIFDKFDYAVCTIPFSSLRRVRVYPLFSVMKMQAISELNYEIGQKTYLFLKDRFWEMGPSSRRIVGGSTSTDLPVTSVFYPSDHAMPIPGVFNGWTLRPGASPLEPGMLQASYNWSEDATRLGNEYDRLRIFDIIRYIEEIHCLPPGFIQNRLISWKTILWSRAQYIWSGACLTKPGDKLLFSHVVTLPEMNDRVFFAGEHISQKHAWQQGALQTGMIAANDVANRVKYKRS